MIIFYGFFDFTSIEGYPGGGESGNLRYYWGAKHSEIPFETLAEMSPMSWVDGNEPPTLLIHGTSDTQVPSWMSENFASKLDDAGVDVELLLLDAGHAFELKPLSDPANVESFEAIEDFLSAQVQ
jgi:dipeptidyl aminopeptidase/acylaminoacyl peptidase